MNTVDTERPPTRTRDSRKPRQGRIQASSAARLKSRPKSKSKSKPKDAAREPREQQKPPSQSDEDWFAVRDIIDEKVEHGRIFYLIDWDGTDSSGCRYDPTWEPAANVAAFAIDDWRTKKAGRASKGFEASDNDADASSVESTQETDPVQVPNWRLNKRKLKQGVSDYAPSAPSRDTTEPAYKRACVGALRAEPEYQQISSPSPSEAGVSGVDELVQPNLAPKASEPRIIVEFPALITFNPSDFRVIPPSGESQASSQATPLERMRPGVEARDQRVIPDSQEISGTSASEAPHSWPDPPDLLGESQFSEDHPVSLEPLGDSLQAPISDIPSHQPDPRFAVGLSGYFTNPNISTNFGVSTGTIRNHSLLHIPTTGSSHGAIDELSPVFQTQPDLDLDIVAATPATISRSTIGPTSFARHSNVHDFPEAESQRSHLTNRGSTPSNSQAAQIVQPLSSHPGEATSQSQSEFSVFEEYRITSDIISGDIIVQADSQELSQALSELDGNIRASATSERHESVLSAGLPGDSGSPRQDNDEPIPPCATVNTQQETRAVTPTNMDGTSLTGTPLSAKERLRLVREGHFNKSPATGSAHPSPAASSPAPSDNNPYIAQKSTPQAEANADSEKSSAGDILIPPVPALPPLPPAATHNQVEVPSELAQSLSNPTPPQEHVLIDPLSLDAYATPLIEQPITLDPSALTLSIENDVDNSPSIATDDAFITDPPPRSTNSDEDDTPTDYPRSLLPHVPTGPCEYLVTLPFQTSSRPQYNDIIRENEALMNEYNSSFRVFPHETPQKAVVERLDKMFSRLFDICDFPPFLESIDNMSPEQVTKHVIGTNAKFSFVAEVLDNMQALNSNKKVLILVRPGKLMDLLGHVIRSRGYRYILSGQEIVNETDAKHLLTVAISSTSDEKSTIPCNVDVVIAFDHTFRQDLLSLADESTSPTILVLVNTASIQHLNMRIMENLQPLERKNVLMLALVKAMRYVEEPDPSESLYSIAEKFSRRIQMPEENEDDFYWEPQSIPAEIFDDLYAASSQISATQPSGHILGADQQPGSRKRSHIDDDNDESLPKRPRIAQPHVVEHLGNISDAVRNLFGDNMARGPEPGTAIVSIDKLQSIAEKFAELESKLKESEARVVEFKELSDRAQKEVDSYASSINNIQTRYMDALKERGIFEADCRTAQEHASMLRGSLDSCQTENTVLKTTQTELKKKLAEANDALLNSSNPDLVKLAELEKNLNTANAEVQRLEKRLIVTQSDADYSKNMYEQASQRAAEISAENRGYEKKMEELKRKADENVIEVNKVQNRNEVRILAQQVREQKNMVRERQTELNRVKEEIKALRNGRRETRQSSVPRSPRLNSLGGVMSPRNGTRGPSAMGGPNSSRGSSPQPPVTAFDGPAGSGNGVQNAALFNQGPGSSRFAHLRDQRF